MLERHLEQLFSDTTLASAPDAHIKSLHTVATGKAKFNALRFKGIAMACLAACALWLAAGAPPQEPLRQVDAAVPSQSAICGEPAKSTSTRERPTADVVLVLKTERTITAKVATPTPIAPPSPTPSPSPSTTATATATATPSACGEPAESVRATATPTATKTATPTPALTPSNTPFSASADRHVTPATPTATGFLTPAPDSSPTRLLIPAIHLEAPIIKVGLTHYQANGQAATTWGVPDYFAVGWHDTLALPGQGGNTVLNGHQNIHGAVFQNLDQLTTGDEVIVYVGAVAYRYRVAEKHLVADEGQPTAVRARNARWILPTPDERLTLVTCAPAPHGDHRLIVVAHPQNKNNP